MYRGCLNSGVLLCRILHHLRLTGSTIKKSFQQQTYRVIYTGIFCSIFLRTEDPIFLLFFYET